MKNLTKLPSSLNFPLQFLPHSSLTQYFCLSVFPSSPPHSYSFCLLSSQTKIHSGQNPHPKFFGNFTDLTIACRLGNYCSFYTTNQCILRGTSACKWSISLHYQELCRWDRPNTPAKVHSLFRLVHGACTGRNVPSTWSLSTVMPFISFDPFFSYDRCKMPIVQSMRHSKSPSILSELSWRRFSCRLEIVTSKLTWEYLVEESNLARFPYKEPEADHWVAIQTRNKSCQLSLVRSNWPLYLSFASCYYWSNLSNTQSVPKDLQSLTFLSIL